MRKNKAIKTDIYSDKNILKSLNRNKNDLVNNSNIFSNSNDLIIDISKKNIFPNTKNINVIRNKKIDFNEKFNNICEVSLYYLHL